MNGQAFNCIADNAEQHGETGKRATLKEAVNFRRKNKLVLSFHGVGHVPARVLPAEEPYWCPAAVFEEILDQYASLKTYSNIDIELTFDDGNDSDLRCALPALVNRSLTGTFFVCAGRLGRRGYLDEMGLRELHDAGMAIGSHGWSHIDWRKADKIALKRELKDARNRISDAVGTEVTRVAIPFGSYDRRVLGQLRKTGISVVYTSDPGIVSGNCWLRNRETWINVRRPFELSSLANPGCSLARLRNGMVRFAKRHR